MTDDIVTRLRTADQYWATVLFSEAADEIERLRNSLAEQTIIHEVQKTNTLSEIERLREWKDVANMFGECFRIDEFGQYPVSNGDDVWQATLAWERLRTKEAHGG